MKSQQMADITELANSFLFTGIPLSLLDNLLKTQPKLLPLSYLQIRRRFVTLG